jgi:NADPH:quinone reductase
VTTLIVLKHMTLIDGTGRAPRENAVLVMRGRHIDFVGDAAQWQPEEHEHFNTLDLSGRFVLPGLIDCHVRTVVEAPGTPLQPGQMVAAVMGGMGREFDGSYAHYTLVPAEYVLSFTTSLPWEIVGAVPETFLTAAGSLDTLQIKRGQTLLVRGGTSSVGMAAIVLAKQQGLFVLATTRNQHKAAQLRERGVDQVLIDSGQIANDVRCLLPGGVNVVLELVRLATLLDSLQATTAKGIVCLTGGLGNVWEVQHFSPMGMIPLVVRLTVSYGSGMIVGQEMSRESEKHASGARRPK